MNPNITVEEDREYLKILLELGLKADPFPIEAPSEVNYWADNKKLLNQLLELQIDMISYPSTNLNIFYGALGAGKTHACNYLSNKGVQEKLAKIILKKELKKEILSMVVVAPLPQKTGQITTAVYKELVHKLLSELTKDDYERLLVQLRTYKRSAYFVDALKNLAKWVTKQLTIDGSAKPVDSIKALEEFHFLTTLKSRTYGTLETSIDLADTLSIIIKTLVKGGKDVIIFIDELEHLNAEKPTGRLLFSSFIRELYDEVENNLNIVLIFTHATYDEIILLLSPAVIDRLNVKGIVNFAPMKTENDLREYFEMNIESQGGNPQALIDKDALDIIIKKILSAGKTGVKPREFNREMKNIIPPLYNYRKNKKLGGSFKITKGLLAGYEKSKKEMVGEIADKLLKGE